jgi:hypothetical protein
MSDLDDDKFELAFPVILIAVMIWIIATGITLLVAGVEAMVIVVFGGFFILMFCLAGVTAYGMLTGRM